MLITLKTFQSISNFAYLCKYDSTRGVFDHVLGRTPKDLGEITEEHAQKVLEFLRTNLEIKKKDKNYVPPKPVEAKGSGTNRGKFGLEGKKEPKKVVMIE